MDGGGMNCKLDQIPFVYLGLPIGGDVRHLSFWCPLIDQIKSRSSYWKNKNLSFSLLSFFKALISIQSILKRVFLWGRQGRGCEER